MNLSPFIATLIFATYFIKDKYHLLIMVFIAQGLSDIIYGAYLSNLSVYCAYFIIILYIYSLKNSYNFLHAILMAVYANTIFFIISNIGHVIAFNKTLSFKTLLNNYNESIPFTLNLFLSTIFFITLFHTLLTIYKRWLAKGLREI